MPDDCRFLMKVRHSAFYSTPLGYLLGRLETKRQILTGQVTEQCILYTALDAYVRHLPVVVPRDAVAHIDPDLATAALKMMQKNMSAEIATAADCLGSPLRPRVGLSFAHSHHARSDNFPWGAHRQDTSTRAYRSLEES